VKLQISDMGRRLSPAHCRAATVLLTLSGSTICITIVIVFLLVSPSYSISYFISIICAFITGVWVPFLAT
jgi:hypothetical protein